MSQLAGGSERDPSAPPRNLERTGVLGVFRQSGRALVMTLIVAALICGLAAAAAVPAAAQEELRVLLREGDGGPMMGYTDAGNSLYRYLQSDLNRRMDAREEEVDEVRTAAEWRVRQTEVREALLDVVGPFPERTPLNARTLGVVERDGYRLEKVVFESRPGNPVTAALFIPSGLRAPAPAVLHLSGHSKPSFRYENYQQIILNLVAKGFVVLAIDEVEQGERLQYTDAELGNLGWHGIPGVQVYLTGGSLAREVIWDGIRAIDYLVTRPEVDATRIGATGRSGGGTQTAYLAAIDDRIAAAAPGLYITSLRRLWETRGPQDAEQHLVGGVARGLDHADLLLARAPRPTLLVTSTRDIFHIQGVLETFAETKRAFTALGAPEMLRRVEGDTSHAYTPAMREAIYGFFQETLKLPGDPTEEAITFLTPEELRITPTGQAAELPGAETMFGLNLRVAEDLRARREAAAREAAYPESIVRAAREISGFQDPGEPGKPVFTGRFHRDGYTIERYILTGEGDYPVPYLLLLPDGDGPHPAVIYLHPDGKAAHAAPGGEMERLVRQGYAVVAPDLVGRGETAPRDFLRGAENPRTRVLLWFGAVSLGRSITGIQAADLVELVRAIGIRPDIAEGGIRAIAHGELAPVLLHAAAFEHAITAITLVEPLISYHDLASTRLYDPRFIPQGIAGMLAVYDLPDLEASLAPRPLLIVNPVDATAAPLEEARAIAALGAVQASYDRSGVPDIFRVVRARSRDAVDEALTRWIEAPLASGQ